MPENRQFKQGVFYRQTGCLEFADGHHAHAPCPSRFLPYHVGRIGGGEECHSFAQSKERVTVLHKVLDGVDDSYLNLSVNIRKLLLQG